MEIVTVLTHALEILAAAIVNASDEFVKFGKNGIPIDVNANVKPSYAHSQNYGGTTKNVHVAATSTTVQETYGVINPIVNANHAR